MEKQKKNVQHEIIRSEGYVTLRLLGDLTVEGAKCLEDDIPALVTEPVAHVIVNCDHVPSMAKPWIRCLLNVERELKNTAKEMRFVLVSEKIEAFFKAEGVDAPFKRCLNVRDALIDLKLATKKTLNADFVNPFLSATMQALKVQAQTDARPGKMYIKQEGDKLAGDVSGVIGLVSESFSGSIVISFPEASFLKIMSRMLGEDYTTLTKEIADGAGELTNMIYGQAKVVLNEKGYGIKTALPSVISGKNHSVATKTNGPIVVVPFETDVGPFVVEICLSG